MKGQRYKAGDRVLLGKIPDEPKAPQEIGTVLSVDRMVWGISVCVRVDAKFKDGPDDDGLRELTVDQIERRL